MDIYGQALLDQYRGKLKSKLWLYNSYGHPEDMPLEISAKACEIMKHRGVKKVVNEDILKYDSEKYDTILLLMNGIGLCEDITGLQYFLDYIKNLLLPAGQLIFDSSDIAYLYKPDEFISSNYYGEISYQYEYQK